MHGRLLLPAMRKSVFDWLPLGNADGKVRDLRTIIKTRR